MKTSLPRLFSVVLLLLLCLVARRSGAEDAATLPDTATAADRHKDRAVGGDSIAGQLDVEGVQGQEHKLENARRGEESSSEPSTALLPKPEALQGRRGALQASQGTPRGGNQARRGLNFSRNPPSCGLCSRERNLCSIVSGIFTRSPLPYGYSLVTPVPAGVCNLTITEMKPSKNYFALRRSDGTYILNGNWDIKTAGEYEAGGTTFIYTPGSEVHGERLSAPGPLREPVDFMLISQSPNPGIEYEYRMPLPDYAGGNPTGLGLPAGTSRPGLGGRGVPGASVLPNPGQHRPFQSNPNLPPRNPSYGIHTPSQGSAFHFGDGGGSGSGGGSNTGRPTDTFMPLLPVLQPVIGVGTSSGFNSSSTSLYPINPHDPLSASPAGTPRRRLPYLGGPQGSSVDVGSRTTARLPGVVPRDRPITPLVTPHTGSLSRPWSPSLIPQDRGRAPTFPGSSFLPGQPFPRGSLGRIVPLGSVGKGFPGQERGGEIVSSERGGRDGKLRPIQTPSRDGKLSVGTRQPLFKATSHHEQPVKTTTNSPLPTHRTRHHHGSPGTQDRRKVPGKSSESPAFDPDVQLTQPKASTPPTANSTVHSAVQRGRGNQDRRHRHHHQLNEARRPGKKRRKDRTRLRVRGGGRFQWAEKGLAPCSRTCGGGNQTFILSCERKRNKKVVADRRCAHLQQPEARFVPCNLMPCSAEWMPGEWEPCSVTCGMGVQTRPLVCKQVVSPTLTMTVPEEACLTPPSIATSQVCEADPCSSNTPIWESGPWTNCSAPCGLGTRSRQVSCSVRGVTVSDDRCSHDARPVREEVCDMGSCATNTWFFSSWSEQCSEQCGAGVQTRSVHCLAGDTQASCSASERPDTSRPCTGQSGCGGQWFVGEWSGCSEQCGAGQETRPVLCVLHVQGRWKMVEESQCQAAKRPQDVRQCNLEPCKPVWYTTDWSQCSVSCGSGIMRREVTCLDAFRYTSPDCDNTTKPDSRRPCHLTACPSTGLRPALTLDTPPEQAAASFTERPAESASSPSPEQENEDSEGDDKVSVAVTEESRSTSEADREVTEENREEIEEEEQVEESKDPLKDKTVTEEEATKEEKEEEENELVVEERIGNDLSSIPRREAQGDESVADADEEGHRRKDKEAEEDEEEEQNEKRRKRKRKKDRKKNKNRRLTESSLGSGMRGPDSPDRPVCIDRIKNCHLVFRARLCRLKYYNKLCCRTCTATT